MWLILARPNKHNDAWGSGISMLEIQMVLDMIMVVDGGSVLVLFTRNTTH